MKARLRFQNADECAVLADQFARVPATGLRGWIGARWTDLGELLLGTRALAPPDCGTNERWSTFDVPSFARVSIRAATQPPWFTDAESGFARSGTRKGILTLRFQGFAPAGGGPGQIFEQNVPLDARFEASTWNLTKSMSRVAGWLIAGALLSLGLRVSIPNYRRKKALKDQLDECARATACISDQVNSQLRVLLRVERLSLEQRRRDGWGIGPDFGDVATRVETGLAVLKRRIALVQRLDASACRRDNLLAGPIAPTRIDIIDRNLNAACEALKSDQLSEPDWLFIQQHLEAADKVLNEQTQEEKQAFEALLSQRWKSIREHFGFAEPAPESEDNRLAFPTTLPPFMEACWPTRPLLPKRSDADGTAWIQSIGVVRADLQLRALEIVRETQFLAPVISETANGSDDTKVWKKALEDLTRWLATPALNNLATARRQLLQLAEGVSEEQMVEALRSGDAAQIELDPQFVTPNTTVRMSVRFRDGKLNAATAREAIACEWRFKPPRATTWRGGLAPDELHMPLEAPNQSQTESGWRINRYFEPEIGEQTVEVGFYHRGVPVMKDGAVPKGEAAKGSDLVTCTRVIRPQEATRQKRDRRVWRHFPQVVQLLAALLVPLAALAASTAGDADTGRWWDLMSLGFGSETIRSILTGQQPPTS